MTSTYEMCVAVLHISEKRRDRKMGRRERGLK
jgi:hypothetical protein